MASSSTSKSLDLEKMNLKLKENPFNFVAGGSSSSLKSKDVTKMKNLKIQETVVTPESDSDDEAAAGSPIVFGRTEGGSSSSGKKKAKSQIKRKKVQIETSTATTTRKKTRFSSTTTTSSSTSSSSSSSSSSSTMVHLRSSDGDIFEVEESIALLSQTITHMIEDGVVAGNVIPLSNISSEILEKVIGFLEKHAGEEEEDRDEKEKEELKKWDENFAEKLKKDQYTLFEMILAANYLSARCLLDVTCQACADMIKGMPPEQIRKFFNIKNDFTPEEEAEVRRENQWAFE